MRSSRPISGPSKVVPQEKETEIRHLCADISSVSRWNAPAPSQHPIPLRPPRSPSRFRDHLSTLRYQLQCRQNLVSFPFPFPFLLFSSSPPPSFPPSNPLIRKQGYLMVPDPKPLPVGLRPLAGSRRHRFPAGVSGHEERVCEWEFSVCGYGVWESVRKR